MSAIHQILRGNQWSLGEGHFDTGLALVRFRKGIPAADATGDHTRLISIEWVYADEGSSDLPDETTQAEMLQFEHDLGDSVQKDALAILTAVVTFEGVRQWVFYTSDESAFIERLSVIPHHGRERFPIKIGTSDDPTWSYLRDEVLGSMRLDA